MKSKKSKAQQLAALLSEKERGIFLKEIKKTSQKKLFKQLISVNEKDSTPDVSKLYKAVFAEKYEEEKSYLLRNEQRHLSKAIIQFLSKVSHRKRFESEHQEVLYLKELFNRNAGELFEREAEKIFEQLELANDFKNCIQVLQLQIEHTTHNKETTPENYQLLLEMSNKQLALLKNQFKHDYLDISKHRAFVERTLKAINPSNEISEIEAIQIDWQSEDSDPYVEYMKGFAQSYALSGNDKIETLKKSIKNLKAVKKPGLNIETAQSTINATIALEYFLMGKYSKSIPFHISAIEQSKNLRDEKRFPYIFNYISTLLRLQQYRESLEIMDEFESIWSELPRMRDRLLCMKAMCHIFLKESEAAAECIPDDRKQSGTDHYYYFRVIQIIVFYLRGDFQLAINEADNFLHTMNYQKKDDDYKTLTFLLKKHFNLLLEKMALSNESFEEKRKLIYQQLQEMKATQSPTHNALLYQWIELELKPKEITVFEP